MVVYIVVEADIESQSNVGVFETARDAEDYAKELIKQHGAYEVRVEEFEAGALKRAVGRARYPRWDDVKVMWSSWDSR